MLQDLRPQLERILGSPSFYQPSEGEGVQIRSGKINASILSSAESRPGIKVQARKRPRQANAQNNNHQPNNDIFNQFFGNNAPQYQNNYADNEGDNENENMNVDGNGTQCNQQ